MRFQISRGASIGAGSMSSLRLAARFAPSTLVEGSTLTLGGGEVGVEAISPVTADAPAWSPRNSAAVRGPAAIDGVVRTGLYRGT